MNDNEQKQNIVTDIPLLEDVITADEIASEFHPFVDSSEPSEDSGIPEYDEVLLAMRDEIAQQLEEDLRAMIKSALNRAIDEAGEQIVRTLHDELDDTLEQKIRFLIDQRLSTEFGPRTQHDPQND
ncbi:MAG: hypothetical protein ABW104_15655 [Candidatus Thiodiazotropha sp. 6PLUC2]